MWVGEFSIMSVTYLHISTLVLPRCSHGKWRMDFFLEHQNEINYSPKTWEDFTQLVAKKEGKSRHRTPFTLQTLPLRLENEPLRITWVKVPAVKAFFFLETSLNDIATNKRRPIPKTIHSSWRNRLPCCLLLGCAGFFLKYFFLLTGGTCLFVLYFLGLSSPSPKGDPKSIKTHSKQGERFGFQACLYHRV